MKKMIAFCLCLTLVPVLLSGCSFDKNGNTTLPTEGTEQSISSEDDPAGTDPAETSNTTTEESSYLSEAGGNPDNAAVKEILVTVSEDKYFVDNHEMSFEELTEEIQADNEGTFVRIFDENATLNAFEKLKNYLEENAIEYELS